MSEPKSTIRDEWRQTYTRLWTSEKTRKVADAVQAMWESEGWVCAQFWAGGHDIRLVGCRPMEMTDRDVEGLLDI